MSISANAVNSIIAFRNPHGQTFVNPVKVLAAQVALVVVIPFILIEATLTNIARISTCLPLSQQTCDKIHSWSSSSAHALLQALVALVTNLCTRILTPLDTIVGNVAPARRREPPMAPLPNISIFNPYILFPEPAHLRNYEKLAGPALDPHRKALYNQYELADNAIRLSDISERMYARLPNPTVEQCQELITHLIPNFLKGAVSPNHIVSKLGSGTRVWHERTMRMLWAIFQKIPHIESADELASIQESMGEAFSNCSNRMSTEIENIYYKYVERGLLDLYARGLSEEECLVYELTQHRINIRDLVISIECPDRHNAASHNYYRRELNTSVFHLPTPPLSQEDLAYEQYAMKEKQADVIAGFNRLFNNEAVIKYFEQMVYSQTNTYKFKPAMFLAWLERTNRRENAFQDDMMTIYKPELLVTFLEEHNFIRRKG